MSEVGAPLLDVRGLSVEFQTRHGTVHAVKDVSWQLDAGRTLAILGESGSGKSVTAAAIMGLVQSPPGFVTAGRVLYRGTDLLKADAEARRKISGDRIAMIFQDTLAALNPVYPVGWQVAETFRAHGVGHVEARARAIELLVRVGIPDARRRAGDYPHQFSGGQRQRIMIAMAIGLRPDLLIADEPTSALDVTVQAQILALLRDLQAETGMSMLLITHDFGVVAEMADAVAVMQDGRIVESSSVARLFKEPQHPYTRRLIDALPGRSAAAAARAAAPEPGALFRVRDLAKSYQATTGLLRRETGDVTRALDGVSFDLLQGETLGIVGESGSGKSTLSRILLALEPPSAGTATYRGDDLFGLPATQLKQLRRRIQAVFQDPTASLNPRMSAAQIIAEPWEVHADVVPKAERRARAIELLQQVGLKPEHADRYPHQFSGGQRQRLAIARALALRPELIVCDEAVSALDVSIQAQVIELLKTLRRDYGLSYIFIAHDLSVVRDFADRVLVMRNGKIVEQGKTEDVFERPQHPYTRDLIAASPILDPDAHTARRDATRQAEAR